MMDTRDTNRDTNREAIRETIREAGDILLPDGEDAGQTGSATVPPESAGERLDRFPACRGGTEPCRRRAADRGGVCPAPGGGRAESPSAG